MGASVQEVRFAVDEMRSVSGLFLRPGDAQACFVLAHGAGAGMDHPAMATVAMGLGERRIATLRFQFPFMEDNSKRPDPPKLAQATVGTAVSEAARLAPDLPLFAGGRSFGGRMTSQAQAGSPLPGVAGLIFLAFPLHPAGRPSSERGAHLSDVAIPMLFLQGTRDALAEEVRMRSLVDSLGPRATLTTFDGADHAFHVPARSGRTDADLRAGLLDSLVTWIRLHLRPANRG